MNEKVIDSLFDSPIPEADINARKVAINSALSEFSQESKREAMIAPHTIKAQHKTSSRQSRWNALISLVKRPNSSHVFATLAVGFATVALVNQLPISQHPERLTQNSEIMVTEPELTSEELASDVDTATSGAAEVSNQIQAEAQAQALDSTVLDDEKRDSTLSSQFKASNQKSKVAAPQESAPLLNEKIEGQLEETIVSGIRRKQTSADVQQLNSSHNNDNFTSLAETHAPPVSIKQDAYNQANDVSNSELNVAMQERAIGYSPQANNSSYEFVRNQLEHGLLPSPNAISTEEIINYFNYSYPSPDSRLTPFKANISLLQSPWHQSKKLIHIGIKGYDSKLAQASNENYRDDSGAPSSVIANDVKVQFEFNPQIISDYRLVGSDAAQNSASNINSTMFEKGKISTGDTITAIYEITLIEDRSVLPSHESRGLDNVISLNNSNNYGALKIRYKLPGQSKASLIKQEINTNQAITELEDNSNVRFSIAVASYAEYLKNSRHINGFNLSQIENMAPLSKANDPFGQRREFIKLLELTRAAKP